ncbi:MAG: DMT family transporter [Bacteroidales bacterium]|nr:DMT family transporter [Bacteroidales bacterium]
MISIHKEHKGYLFFIYILAILSMLLWGMTFVWSKIVFKYYSPITTIFLRLIISSIILFIFIFITKKTEKIKKEDYKLFLFSALFNPFLYFIGESYGIKLTSSTISAVIIATIPLFTPIAAYFTLKEKLSRLNILGLIISFSGILLMILNKNFSLNASPYGIAWLLFAVITAVFYAIILKKLTNKYSPITIISVQNLIGAFYFLPLFLIFDYNDFIHIRPNTELISNLLQLSIFGSSIAFVCFTIAVRELGVSKANIFSNFIPIFTAIFSYFILSEAFNMNKIAGMIIVVIGVMLSQINKKGKIFNFYRFFYKKRNIRKL